MHVIIGSFAWSTFGAWNRVSNTFSFPIHESAPETVLLETMYLDCVWKSIRSCEQNFVPEGRFASLYSVKATKMSRLTILSGFLFYGRFTGQVVVAKQTVRQTQMARLNDLFVQCTRNCIWNCCPLTAPKCSLDRAWIFLSASHQNHPNRPNGQLFFEKAFEWTTYSSDLAIFSMPKHCLCLPCEFAH